MTMENTKSPLAFFDIIWDLFVSLKFTVVLLAAWLVGSVIGTLILQNGTPERYVELYGPGWSNVFMKLGFFDAYHSTWYAVILLLLLLNIVACSLNTLPGKLALAFKQPQTRVVKGSGKRYVNRSFQVANAREAAAALAAALGRRYKNVERFDEDGAERLFAQRQTFSYFMVYVVHLSVVVIILGGVVSSLFGFEGVMDIPIGQTRDFMFRKSGMQHTRMKIDYNVRLDDFRLERFASGGPKDYISTLTVIDAGRVGVTKSIEVNDPLSYGAYNFYQSTYSELAPLVITDRKTGRSERIDLGGGNRAFLEDIGVMVGLNAFIPKSSDSGMSASVTVSGSANQVFRFAVTGDEALNSRRQKDMPFAVSFHQSRPVYVTGLMVVSDPGVGWVWLGSFLMVVGLYLTFYTSHRQISVRAKGDTLELTGRCHRNPSGFRREIDAILREAGFDNDRADDPKLCSWAHNSVKR